MDSLLLGASATPLRFRKFAPARSICAAFQISHCKAAREGDRLSTGRSQGCLVNHSVKSIDKQLGLYSRSVKLLYVNAAAGHSLGSEPEAYSSKNTWTLIKTSLDAFYRFSRPHTVIGTATSIISVSLLAVERLSDISPLFFTGLLEAVVAALFMNIYIVGLNQLFDIEIDKVNKPNLPLASGEYSVRTGTAIVSIFALMSFFMGWMVGSWPLFWALFISFMLGTAYSINLPYLRWKRFAVVAAICILAVRAVIVQLAFFLHMQTFVFSRPVIVTRPLIFATAFMSFFSVVIALFKDIPDIDGDRIFGIRSFSVRLGQQKVFWICVCLLELAYVAAVVVGALSPCAWSKYITVLGHAGLASVLWTRARSLDLNSKASITSFYMFIWKLFYAEYLLVPLVR
uniref:Putative homogentisate phytyltransferase 1, chloroplastic n=1 Tax=Anthurium amnicola TaxID=1678845 RepID=A0A1D1YFU5_9ARAE